MTNQPDIFIERDPEAKAKFGLLKDMRVERGTIADWNDLHSLHYKSESLPPGPRFWRCVTGDNDLVGITVLGSVSLLLAPRHRLFPKLKPGNDSHFTNVHRGRWLNSNFRRAARIVTDTMFRGVGVSYRMVNLSMRLEGFRFVEIQSSMSKFNPFDLKAGFRHGELTTPTLYKQGLPFLRSLFKAHPADYFGVMKEYDEMPYTVRASIDRTVKEFYYRHSAKEKTGPNLNKGTERVDLMPFSDILKELQQLIFASPVYGIWENPDLGVEMPESLPLYAFDLQKPTEPLRMDLL